MAKHCQCETRAREESRSARAHPSFSHRRLYLDAATPTFRTLAPALHAAGINLAIATHSDEAEFGGAIQKATHILGDELAHAVLRHALPSEVADAFVVFAYNPRARGAEGLRPENLFKRRHLRQIAARCGGGGLAYSELCFFDDDARNVRDCHELGVLNSVLVDGRRGLREEDVARACGAAVSRSSVLTLNVWFANESFELRLRALLATLRLCDAAFICLQEVTPPVAAALRGCAILQRRYAVSPNDVGRYGCLILSKRALGEVAFGEVALPTRMGRTLVTAVVAMEGGGGGLYCVATVHLESLSSAPTRREQLVAAELALRPYRAAVLCGDFNFDSTRNFNEGGGELENAVLGEVLGPAWIDAWAALRPSEPGYTFDSVRNGVIGARFERMRYDRVMVRGLAPAAIRMVGTERLATGSAPEEGDGAVAPPPPPPQAAPALGTPPQQRRRLNINPSVELREVWLSDHFGLHCTLAPCAQ